MLICQELGCVQQIGVARGFLEAGRPMRWFKDCLVDVLRAAAGYAADLQIEIAFEYTNRHEINTINTAAEAIEIIERVGSDTMGLLLDTYHSYLEDHDLLEAIYNAGEYLRYVHLHDSNRGAAIIGGGETNFERVIELCGEIGYSGWFSDGLRTLDYSAEEVRRSTSMLRSLYERYLPSADRATVPVL
jgi:D-psicose/D-tagatose/L-ribulose 3-epimerase